MLKCCSTPLIATDPFQFDRTLASYLVAADAVGLVEKFWPNDLTLYVSFRDFKTSEKSLIMEVAKVWSEYANLRFTRVDKWEDGDIRISGDPRKGSWSYIGTDCKNINLAHPTMNLGWLDVETILHEFGHALGLLHEHQNPFGGGFKWNKENVIKDLSGPPNNWPKDRIEWNMFHMYSQDLLRGTSVDLDSIMLYFFPAHWTQDGKATKQNKDLSDKDKEFISKVYPYYNKPVVEPDKTHFEDVMREAVPERRYMNGWNKHTLKVVAAELGVNTQKNKSKFRLSKAISRVLDI